MTNYPMQLPRVDWYCYSSEFNLDKGGAVDIVLAVLDTLHVTQATFFGSDWGGGICLSIALKCPNMVQRLVVMHANYAEKKSGELRRIVPKVTQPKPRHMLTLTSPVVESHM